MRNILLLSVLVFSTVVFSQQDSLMLKIQQLENRINELEAKNAKRASVDEKAKAFLDRFKISGYFHLQWRVGEVAGVDSPNDIGSFSGGKLNLYSNQAFTIRRGRLKFTYSDKIFGGVFQLDATDKELTIKDIYLTVTEPWTKWFTLQGGIFDRPFGYEVSYSSSLRESPERARVMQALFPEERDMGVKIMAKAPKGSVAEGLWIEFGGITGNGITSENDSKLDFLGRIRYDYTKNKTWNFGLGTSVYLGQVFQLGTERYYIKDNMWQSDGSTNQFGYNMRNYFGVDGQVSAQYAAKTTFRAEFVTGVQPSQYLVFNSPRRDNLSTVKGYEFMRDFVGASAILVQSLPIPKAALSVVLKYDYLDPNTKVKGGEIGVGTEEAGKRLTTLADIAYHTYGVGLVYDINKTFRVMAYCDLIYNEIAPNYYQQLGALDPYNYYATNVPDNVFTLRLQIKF